MIPIFSNPSINVATTADVNDITKLLNSAYRGESSKAGWTHEEHLIDGEIRTNAEMPGRAPIPPFTGIAAQPAGHLFGGGNG